MKKHLLMFLVAVTAATMSLNARVVLIDEGFENGIQESVWTQVFVAGEMPWGVESVEENLMWPSTVVEGTHRAYLRNNTGETQGYRTRLVSQVMNLSPAKVYLPSLSFWYANPKWGADRDTLRVLYRTNSYSAWKTMAELSSTGSDWQYAKMPLPEVSATYQIAFEGKDNLGRGIVLDDIKLQSAPDCTIPADIAVFNKGAGKVNIAWTASWDANYFEVIVSKDTIEPDRIEEIEAETPEKIAYHSQVSGAQQNCDVVLESGEFYLVYIRSICDDENSAWSSEATEEGPFGFRVRMTKQVPFTEQFNYASGVLRDEDWSWGGNTGNTNPYVNSSTKGNARAYYSPDTTAAVIFSGGTTTSPSTFIPADRYVYMATPALTDSTNDDFQVNQCQVHFWSTVYTNTGRQNGRGIIVGVMDDPGDITSFQPVDTITVWGNKAFQENIVDLGSYQGTGAYVAFVSRFDRQNLFYMDNLTIEYRKDVNKVTEISVNPRDTYADITWKGNAASYDVLVTNAEVNPNNPAQEAIVDQATVTTNHYQCDQLEADHSWNRPYYVYVKAAGTEWSYRYPFVTVAPMREIPYSFDFEASTTTKYTIPGVSGQFAEGLGIFGNSGTYPAVYVSSANSYGGSGHLFLSKRGGTDAWITLPMVADLSAVQVKFFLSGGATFDQAHATVGVMSNPMDINTFIPVSHFTLNATGYTRCYANFENYSGPDGVIAILWDDVKKMSENTINYIDAITVEELSDCVPPTNMELQIEPDSISVSWETSQSEEWEFFLSCVAIKESDRVNKTKEQIAAMTGVAVAETLSWPDHTTKPQFGFGGLTPHANYYLYVRATCDMDWWSETMFSTPCREETFPYKEMFENYNLGGTTAGCWQLADYLGVGYPSIYNVGSSTSTNKALNLYSSGTIHRSIAILPAVEGNLSNMLLSFDVRSFSSSPGVVIVGTMEDIEDQSTFVPFDTIQVSGTAFKKARFILSNYELAYNQIAITSGLGSLMMNSDVLIDNVELKDPSCIEPYDFHQPTYAPHDINLTWSGTTDNDTWEVKVLTANVATIAIKNGTYDHSLAIVDDTLVVGKNFQLGGLRAQSTYYVYVRGLCGDSTWVSTPATTSCELLDPTRANKETFESYSSGTGSVPNCWYSGNGSADATDSYRPYIYNSSTYSSSGTRTFRMYGYDYYDYTPAYIASPEIKCDSLTQIMVTFNMYSGSSYSWLLGVMSDPYDLSTFVVIDSIGGTGQSVQYSYDLSEYVGLIPSTAKYIAWRTPYGMTSYAYLDDVSFISVACPLTKPSISELTGSSVRISSGLRTSDNWIILVTNHLVSEEDLSDDDYHIPASWIVYQDTVSTRSKEIFGLQGQTKYYVATTTLCDDAQAPWSTLSFMTPCVARTPEALGTVTFSAEEGFETGTGGETPCWTVGSKTQNASSSYIPYIDDAASTMHNGKNYLKLYDYVSSSSSYVGAYAIMPELDVDSISKYQVNFWGRSNNSSSNNNQVIVGVISDPSDLNTFVALDTLNLSKSTWDPYSVGFENYMGDYMGDLGRNIMFLSDFGSTNYAYISEVSVELIPKCRPISSFTVDSVGEDAAIISWKGYQDSYRLLLANKALEESEKKTYRYLLDTIVDHSDDILITGLQPNANYYVYAQGICEDGDSTAISVTYAAIHTTCPTVGGAPLPFFDDFESYEKGEPSPGCWQILCTGSRSMTYHVVTENSNSGTKAIDVWSTSSNGCYIVVPKVDADLANLRLTFDACSWGGSSATKMYVGVMADVNDVTTFVLLNTFDLAPEAAYTHCTMDLSEYELPYDNLVITSGIPNVTPNTYDNYLDNVGLEYLASCNAPKLRFVGSSFTSATIALTPARVEDSQWQLVVIDDDTYATIGDINQYLATATKIDVNSTNVELTGLEPATSYYIFARAICGANDQSTWTRNPLKISTQYYFAEDYFFGFEKTGELWERSPYSESDNYYLHPALKSGRDSVGTDIQSYLYYPHSRENTGELWCARTGTGAMLLHADGNTYGGYVIFPSVGEPKDRSFSFKVRPGYVDGDSKLPKHTFPAQFEVGTIDKERGFETYQTLATLHLDKLNTATKATAKNNQLFSNYSLDLDSATIATKQIVFYLPKQTGDTANVFFDDVALDASKGFSLVSLKKVQADGASALVEWNAIGGPWNLYITTAAGVAVAQYLNLTSTSQLVENLNPQTDYIARLEAVTPHSGFVTTDKLAFHTLCLALEPDAQHSFAWNFDNPNDWEKNDVLAGEAADSLYFKPACFTVGKTYDTPVNGFQWLIQRKGYEAAGALSGYNASAHVEVGRNDSHALRICTAMNTANAYFNSYIVLPELNIGLDTMMIEFYGRCFTNFDETYPSASGRGKITATAWLGSGYSQSLVVGTLTDPADFSTLQVIDTVTYSHTDLTTNTNVNNDPDGLRYWEQMRLPLTGAQGKYIVLFQPAPGLFYLDDLSVKPIGNTMFAPTGTRVMDVTANTADIAWNTRYPELPAVVVLYGPTGQELFRDTISGTQYQLTNLQPGMNYQWIVYQLKENEASPASKPFAFVTDCAPIAPEFFAGFEPREGWAAINGQPAYTQNLCWYYGDAVQGEWKSSTYDPYNQANTNDFSYSYSGEHALVMRASYSSRAAATYQPYVALPQMDVQAYDTLQVRFMMRPAYVSAANDSVLQSFTGSAYSKSIIVGTMTDPANAATFVPIDTVTYDGTLSPANEANAANNFLFQDCHVELRGATGPYIALMTSFYAKGSSAQKTGDYVWIDDLSFERISECKDPTGLQALTIGSVYADLAWNGIDSAGSYLLQVSTDPYFADEEAFVFNEAVSSNSYRVTHLQPQTTYVWRVQAICGERWGESAFSQKATFKTSRSPYFLEECTTNLNANEWTFSKTHADIIVDSTGVITRGVDNWGFTRTTNSYGLEGSHYMAQGYSADFHWLVTPNFFLPENDSVHFSMDLALTACNTAHLATSNAVTDNDMKDDFFFMIIISDDGGQTWKSKNILDKWQNTNPVGKQLRDIPATGTRVRYSLAPYAGKNIRIGLYREAKSTVNTGIAIHVDNIRLAYFDKEVEYASACQYEDVKIGDIVLSGDDTEPGIHAYPQPVYVSDAEAKAGKRDSVFQLEIEVFPAQEVTFNDTICEGETYTGHDFLPKTTGGTYRRKLHSAVHGCDSIVTLNLCMHARRYAEDLEVAICPGEPYSWHGHDYNRAGIYRDTTISSVGCDSIETLIISYAEAEQTIYAESHIEIGDLPFTYNDPAHPYIAIQTPISYPEGTPAGTYIDTAYVQGAQCAAMLIHTLVITDPQGLETIEGANGTPRKVLYRDNMYIILDDEWYNASGQKVADPRL